MWAFFFFLFKMSNLFLDHSSNAGFVGKYWPSNIHINNVEPVKAAKERELRACRGCQISNGPAVRSQWVWWLRIFLGPNPNIIPRHEWSGRGGRSDLRWRGVWWGEGDEEGGKGSASTPIPAAKNSLGQQTTPEGQPIRHCTAGSSMQQQRQEEAAVWRK